MKTIEKKTVPESGPEQAGIRLLELFHEVFSHEGFGHLEVDMRFLKRGQKEILLRAEREYRFVVDYSPTQEGGEKAKKTN